MFQTKMYVILKLRLYSLIKMLKNPRLSLAKYQTTNVVIFCTKELLQIEYQNNFYKLRIPHDLVVKKGYEIYCEMVFDVFFRNRMFSRLDASNLKMHLLIFFLLVNLLLCALFFLAYDLKYNMLDVLYKKTICVINF